MAQEPIDSIGRLSLAVGRDLAQYDAPFLARVLHGRQAATGCVSAPTYLHYLTEHPREADALADALTVTYSEFFRSPLAFALLEAQVLPDLAQEKAHTGQPEIRIWSAGCAAGQEAYSVAILLAELAATCGRPIPYRIFASDIAMAELAAGQAGIYTAAAVQNVRLRHLNKYFTARGDAFSIGAQVREHVDFLQYDLLDTHSTCPPASIYGDFDLVLCCNVLIYYRPETRRFLLDKLRCCLAPNGYLVTGETERILVEQAGGFVAVAPPAAVFQRVRQIR